MNRLYPKPKLNPVCKLHQQLPTLPMILRAKGEVRATVPVPELDQNFVPAAQAKQGGGLISLCKNFAFSNLF